MGGRQTGRGCILRGGSEQTGRVWILRVGCGGGVSKTGWALGSVSLFYF